LDLGTGKLNYVDDYVEIPDKFLLKSNQNLITTVFGNNFAIENIIDSVILCPLNKNCTEINNIIVDKIFGTSTTYYSTDSIDSDDSELSSTFPTEFLNKLEISCLPPHRLYLKENIVVLLIKNIKSKLGKYNY
jgi:hypothetical protein